MGEIKQLRTYESVDTPVATNRQIARSYKECLMLRGCGRREVVETVRPTKFTQYVVYQQLIVLAHGSNKRQGAKFVS